MRCTGAEIAAIIGGISAVASTVGTVASLSKGKPKPKTPGISLESISGGANSLNLDPLNMDPAELSSRPQQQPAAMANPYAQYAGGPNLANLLGTMGQG